MKAMCQRCGAGGNVYVPRASQEDGQTYTNMVRQDCPECGGVGWLPFPGAPLGR